MAWICLIMAGCFEVVGVTGMNKVIKDRNLSSYLLLMFGFALSFTLLSLAMQSLPVGLSYAVWTGIGTVGAAVIGMLFYGESKDWRRILCIALIVTSIIGLKISS
ncbi:MAG: DMT family transporter [Bacillus sp. (in: firmicutes)]